MTRSFTFVTTCSQAGWIEYAETMVDSFDRNFPPEVKLIVYVDFKSPENRSRVEFRQIAETGMRLENYHFSLRDLDFALGTTVPYSEHDFSNTYNIIWNARKFSFKVFTICHAIRTSESDVVVWLDADSNIVAPIDHAVIARSMPDYAMVSYLGRSWRYTECGYVGYNMRHPLTAHFAETVVQMYKSGAVFSLKEWHDSYVFDVVRVYFEETLGVTNFNIAANVDDVDHVFLNTELGLYIDHMKGPRKTEGQSRSADRITTYGVPDEEAAAAAMADQDPEVPPVAGRPEVVVRRAVHAGIEIVANEVILKPLGLMTPTDVLVELDQAVVCARTLGGPHAAARPFPLPASVYDDREHILTVLDRQTREMFGEVAFTKTKPLVETQERLRKQRKPYVYPETDIRAVSDLFNNSIFHHDARAAFDDRPSALDHLGYLPMMARDRATVAVLLFCSAIDEVWHSAALRQLATAEHLDIELVAVMQSREACRYARRRLQGSSLDANVQIVAVEQLRAHLKDQRHLDAVFCVPTGAVLTTAAIDRLESVALGRASGFAGPVARVHPLPDGDVDVIWQQAVGEWAVAQDILAGLRLSEFSDRTRTRSEVAEGVTRILLEIETDPDPALDALRLGRALALDGRGWTSDRNAVVQTGASVDEVLPGLERLLATTLDEGVRLTVVGPIPASGRVRQVCTDHGIDVVPSRPFETPASPLAMMALCVPARPVLAVDLDRDVDTFAPLATLLVRSERPRPSSVRLWRNRVSIDSLASGDADAAAHALKKPEFGGLLVHTSARR